MPSTLVPQDKFSTSLLSPCSSTDTVIYLNALPTAQAGYLTIDEGLVTEEVIYYTSVGSNFVTCPSLATGRGVYGSAVGHSGSAIVKMKTVAEYFKQLQSLDALTINAAGGWIPAEGTWVYASANTITVPTNDAAKLSVGSKIQINQSGIKYFYVVGVSGTTITITGGSDYTLANAAITGAFLSNWINPFGFPQWFNYTMVETGFASTTPTRVSRFTIVGRKVTVVSTRTSNTTSNATTYTMTAPVTSANIASMVYKGIAVQAQDNGSPVAVGGIATIANNTNIINVYTNAGGGAWTASGTKGVDITLEYEI